MIRKLLVLAAVLLIASAKSTLAAGGPPPVPEIDPSSIIGAVTLLSGGLLVLGDRRRAK
ncbi:MAG: hypothetical protein SFX72_13495 [Isosphaeraceae bacterium]|nr:hypothetical protein [Isosphaeraceae bacterium]